ncbi:MAG TPA: hypothetical protein VH234_01775 [Candidatus Saccharimonadales bacterium]|nr:hypothetical protein [Candidatus Saccharimonadales bacterium]
MDGLHRELFEAVRNYKMPPPAVKLLKQSPPLIISAVTAGGKTTTGNRIVKKSDYRHVVTHTTRTIRPGEANGVNYWFVNQAEMLELIKQGVFIEVQPVHGDTIYGTSLESYQSVIKTGHKPLLIMDVQGIQEIISNIPQTQAFFMLPPSYETWMDRLQARGNMNPLEKARRLQSAKKEIETVLADSHFVLVINYDIERTADEILQGPSMADQRASREIAQRLVDRIKI